MLGYLALSVAIGTGASMTVLVIGVRTLARVDFKDTRMSRRCLIAGMVYIAVFDAVIIALQLGAI